MMKMFSCEQFAFQRFQSSNQGQLTLIKSLSYWLRFIVQTTVFLPVIDIKCDASFSRSLALLISHVQSDL